MVEIESGSRIQYGGRLILQTGSSLYLSLELRFVDEIWLADRFWHSEGIDINKYEPEVVLSAGGRHFEKSIWLHKCSYVRSGWANLDEIRQQ